MNVKSKNMASNEKVIAWLTDYVMEKDQNIDHTLGLFICMFVHFYQCGQHHLPICC